MRYPKPIMSISELLCLGFSRDELLRYAHMKNSPARKTPGGGKFKFDTEKLQKIIEDKD